MHSRLERHFREAGSYRCWNEQAVRLAARDFVPVQPLNEWEAWPHSHRRQCSPPVDSGPLAQATKLKERLRPLHLMSPTVWSWMILYQGESWRRFHHRFCGHRDHAPLADLEHSMYCRCSVAQNSSKPHAPRLCSPTGPRRSRRQQSPRSRRQTPVSDLNLLSKFSALRCHFPK